MDQQELDYERLACAGHLHRWTSHSRGGDELLAVGQIARGEFKRMYTGQLVRNGSPARPFYDQIKLSAPNNICPYCGFGTVETLDHFLPKSHYSSLSVLPLNLVPACSDCNKKKHDTAATEHNISSHPYFEEACVFEDQWLYARIIQSSKPAAEFYVIAPALWAQATTQRVLNHFRSFHLAGRYATQAAERLMVLAAGINEVVKIGVGEDIDVFLRLTASSETRLGRNSWQAALAKAVADDVWFRTGGYARLL
jgi:5-methylcytosine-specific restriction endonuclease McrA